MNIDKKTALRLSALFGKVVNKRASIPCLSCVKLESSGNGSTVATVSNLTEYISVEVGGDCNGSALFPYVEFEKVLKAAKTRNLILHLAINGRCLVNDSAEYTVSIDGDDSAEFPQCPAGGMIRLPNKADSASYGDILKAIKWAIPAASKDQTRYVLNGVFIDEFATVATDGRRLAVRDMINPFVEILPDTKVFRSGILDNKSGGTVAVYGNDYATDPGATHYVEFKAENVTYSVRAVEGQYPDYKQCSPDTSQQIDGADFGDCIEWAKGLPKSHKAESDFVAVYGKNSRLVTVFDGSTVTHASGASKGHELGFMASIKASFLREAILWFGFRHFLCDIERQADDVEEQFKKNDCQLYNPLTFRNGCDSMVLMPMRGEDDLKFPAAINRNESAPVEPPTVEAPPLPAPPVVEATPVVAPPIESAVSAPPTDSAPIAPPIADESAGIPEAVTAEQFKSLYVSEKYAVEFGTVSDENGIVWHTATHEGETEPYAAIPASEPVEAAETVAIPVIPPGMKPATMRDECGGKDADCICCECGGIASGDIVFDSGEYLCDVCHVNDETGGGKIVETETQRIKRIDSYTFEQASEHYKQGGISFSDLELFATRWNASGLHLTDCIFTSTGISLREYDDDSQSAIISKDKTGAAMEKALDIAIEKSAVAAKMEATEMAETVTAVQQVETAITAAIPDIVGRAVESAMTAIESAIETAIARAVEKAIAGAVASIESAVAVAVESVPAPPVRSAFSDPFATLPALPVEAAPTPPVGGGGFSIGDSLFWAGCGSDNFNAGSCVVERITHLSDETGPMYFVRLHNGDLIHAHKSELSTVLPVDTPPSDSAPLVLGKTMVSIPMDTSGCVESVEPGGIALIEAPATLGGVLQALAEVEAEPVALEQETVKARKGLRGWSCESWIHLDGENYHVHTSKGNGRFVTTCAMVADKTDCGYVCDPVTAKTVRYDSEHRRATEKSVTACHAQALREFNGSAYVEPPTVEAPPLPAPPVVEAPPVVAPPIESAVSVPPIDTPPIVEKTAAEKTADMRVVAIKQETVEAHKVLRGWRCESWITIDGESYHVRTSKTGKGVSSCAIVAERFADCFMWRHIEEKRLDYISDSKRATKKSVEACHAAALQRFNGTPGAQIKERQKPPIAIATAPPAAVPTPPNQNQTWRTKK